MITIQAEAFDAYNNSINIVKVTTHPFYSSKELFYEVKSSKGNYFTTIEKVNITKIIIGDKYFTDILSINKYKLKIGEIFNN